MKTTIFVTKDNHRARELLKRIRESKQQRLSELANRHAMRTTLDILSTFEGLRELTYFYYDVQEPSNRDPRNPRKLLSHRAGNEELRHDTAKGLRSTVDLLSPKSAISVISYLGHGTHLPMVDFSIPKNDYDSLHIVIESLRLLDLGPGYVLDSGSSYHFLGTKPMSDEYYNRQFIPKLVLLSPIVDHRWAAHRQLSGYAALRVTKTPRHEHEPRLVAVIGLDAPMTGVLNFSYRDKDRADA